MLPILPVLLLLLVNAPSKVDRVAGLRAIGVLESLHRKMEGGARQEPPATVAEVEDAWASLLSLSLGSDDLERAFATLLGLHSALPDLEQPDGPVVAEPAAPVPVFWEPDTRLEPGCLACRRTRDGPLSR